VLDRPFPLSDLPEPPLEDAREDTAMTEAAMAILEANGRDAYAQALAALREDTREWWESKLENDERYKADAESLLGFLLVRGLQKVRRTWNCAPTFVCRPWGESFDPDGMDRLMQLDERLVRQYEKLAGMLGRLQKSR
jgi:hypothetical protein